MIIMKEIMVTLNSAKLLILVVSDIKIKSGLPTAS